MFNLTKLKVLWDKVEELAGRLGTVEQRTPPDYSTNEEIATGRKWIDGKYIFVKSYIGSTDGSAVEIDYGNISADCDKICYLGYESFLLKSNGLSVPLGFYVSSTNHYDFYFDNTNKKLFLTTSTASSGIFTVFVFYTKLDPVPAEVTTKKTRNTKKEEGTK